MIGYETPEEAASAAQGQTDAALGFMIWKLQKYLKRKEAIHMDLLCLEIGEDEEELLTQELKFLKDQERSAQAIASCLQSRLKVG